jgi:hypothetical protein
MKVSLTLTEDQHKILAAHLFPPDGCEAVAIILCGRAAGAGLHRLLAHRVELVPYSSCSVRKPDSVTWSTDILVPLLVEAERRDWAVVKIHGHRGYDRFSEIDDQSDRILFPSIHCWLESEMPHASVIMMDDGRCFGRVVTRNGGFEALGQVAVVGNDIKIYEAASYAPENVPEHARRVAQTFGQGTYDALTKLCVGVVGCSGTGSAVIEQLARNCVGTLVLVDPDRVEPKNLNRIYNSTREDAKNSVLKVDLARRSIEAIGMGTTVMTFATTLFEASVVRALAKCDIVFGCMDTVDGRFALNKLASFYLIPYFDLGVRIDADGRGGVEQVAGSVHYVKPGGSSLLSRNLFTMEQVRVAGLYRTDPAGYEKFLKEGYIRGVNEDRPAVVHLNTLVASLAVNELLARIHPYRLDPNSEFSIVRVSLSHGIFDHEAEGAACPIMSRHTGRGDVQPLLDFAELSGGGN